VVLIDTDVLLLAFAFQQDDRQPKNKSFLERVQTAEPGITVFNLLEFLGQMSFNLSPTELDKWQSWLVESFRLNVIWPVDPKDEQATLVFKSDIFDRSFAKMRAYRMSFMDALILDLAERTPNVAHFVTWNARHFKNKTTLNVLTPEEYVNQAR